MKERVGEGGGVSGGETGGQGWSGGYMEGGRRWESVREARYSGRWREIDREGGTRGGTRGDQRVIKASLGVIRGSLARKPPLSTRSGLSESSIRIEKDGDQLEIASLEVWRAGGSVAEEGWKRG